MSTTIKDTFHLNIHNGWFGTKEPQFSIYFPLKIYFIHSLTQSKWNGFIQVYVFSALVLISKQTLSVHLIRFFYIFLTQHLISEFWFLGVGTIILQMEFHWSVICMLKRIIMNSIVVKNKYVYISVVCCANFSVNFINEGKRKKKRLIVSTVHGARIP